ncbi:class I SAM-dependent methyltransferase [Winogradskyella ursingii]|uniref:class I SAM-dependent methyltransferase n=1 Tax=Winogradskyella ursingii TaxID=2686079 RepID=UPI0015C85533|nr:class I SAM-dependent methyltransferase [Winogradskyella ursingii]
MNQPLNYSDNQEPNYIGHKYPIQWSMSRAEKATLIEILNYIKPTVAIEIGTYNGGSLQVLSDHSEKVYAIDITPDHRDSRCDNFENVTYLIGDSKTELPKLIHKIAKNEEIIEFILIDGDHSTEGVLRDLYNVLQIVPKKPVTIILHDSFNPNCRAAMKAFDYNSNPYVNYVELDYVTGAFNHDGLFREMWGGFACIQMQPDKRQVDLVISEYQAKLYKIIYYKSKHFYKKFFGFLKPFYRIFKK